jgi:hypothetical protein
VLGVRSVYSDDDFTGSASELIMHNFGEAAKMHLAWRDAYAEEHVLDVRFSEVIGDERALLRRIYAWLGIEVTDRSASNLAAWLAMDARREHVRNTATLADFGVTPADVGKGMSAYIERYREYL